MFDAQRLFVTRASLTDCLTNHPGWCCREYHVWMISSDSGLLHKFSESALMCEKRRVPVVDLPVLVICGTESQSSCTKIICELQLKDIRFSCHPHREQLEVILWGSCSSLYRGAETVPETGLMPSPALLLLLHACLPGRVTAILCQPFTAEG